MLERMLFVHANALCPAGHKLSLKAVSWACGFSYVWLVMADVQVLKTDPR